MNRPLEIRDVKNISLVASDDNSDVYPQLVAQFTCPYVMDTDCIHILYDERTPYIVINACCSAILMLNVTHAALEGINITTETPNISAIILQQCSHVHIQSVAVHNIPELHNDSNDFEYEIGILTIGSRDIEMGSLKASNFANGVILYNSSSTKMINVSAANNRFNGIDLIYCIATSMTDVYAVHNKHDGIYSYYCTNTSMTNLSAAYNELNGMFFYHSTITSMMKLSAVNNVKFGILFSHSNDTSMTTISTLHNKGDGIVLQPSTNTRLTNVYTVYNGFSDRGNGIFLASSSDTKMMNISALQNAGNGILVTQSSDTNMINVSTIRNGYDGIFISLSEKTSMMNVSAVRNRKNGIGIISSSNTNINHTYTYHYGMIACTNFVYQTTGNVYVYNNRDTHIMNSVVCVMEIINATNIYITNASSPITAYSTTNIFMSDSIFHNMDVQSTVSSTSEPASLPAVITVYGSTLTITNCTFTGNKISSIKTFSSNVTLSGKVLFHNNTALLGTAVIFERNSILITTVSSNIHFQNNHAINYGGVFYIDNEEFYETSMTLQDIVQINGGGSLLSSRTECFVCVEGSRSHARLTFINNTAGKGGDILYGGLVALGYDGDWNCLLSFENISDMSQQRGLSRISSAPSRVCLCNETGQPDYLTVADPTTRVIYPGQTIIIPAVVTGQDFGITSGSVFAQFLRTPYTTDSIDMEPRHSIDVEQRQCSNLEYTIFSQSEESEAVLVLTHNNIEISHLMNEEDNQKVTNTWEILSKEPNYKTLARDIICDFLNFTTLPATFTIKYNESNQPGNRTIENLYKFTPAPADKYNRYCDSTFLQTKFVFPKHIYSYPAYINVSFRPCPLGFSLSKHSPFRCDCNQLIKQLPGVKCHIQDETISRCGLVWISSDGNETVTASNCPYNYCNREKIYMTLEDPDSQCNFNHSGTLCGGCQPGLSLALGTNQCLHCSNNHLALILPFALAGVVLVCFIKVIDLTISQGTLNGLVFFANIVKANEYLPLQEKQTNPLAVFIAWLNLDLGVETCFYNGLTAYGKTWLQFVFPLYIWSIAGLIIILAKYSDRVAKVMGNNSVPILATLFLLSYAKLFRNIITALSFTMLSTTHGSKAVWSADGNLDYLGPEHAPLFAVAVATLLFLWLPYTLLLFLGQWLHRCNCRLITRLMMKIKPFLDAHYGPLKGNHRYWFGALLLMRAVILLISALIPTNRAIITVYSINVCTLVLIGFAVGVYRSFSVAIFDAVWFVNLGLLSASYMFTTFEGYNLSIAVNCFFGLAFAQFIGLVIFKVVVIIKRSERLMACLHWRQPAEDDWEPYEQAALQREMESDSEGEESEETGSIVSVQTYGY